MLEEKNGEVSKTNFAILILCLPVGGINLMHT